MSFQKDFLGSEARILLILFGSLCKWLSSPTKTLGDEVPKKADPLVNRFRSIINIVEINILYTFNSRGFFIGLNR